MNEKTIFISVSKIEQFNRLLESEDAAEPGVLAAMVDKWIRRQAPTFNMKIGNAFHSYVEKGAPEGDFQYFNNNKRDSNGKEIDFTGEEVFLSSFEFRKVREWIRKTAPFRNTEIEVPAWSIRIGEYRFIITGRIDEEFGPYIGDHKLAVGKPPSKYFDQYSRSMQWRFYLSMTGKFAFFYNIFYRRDGVEAWTKDAQGNSIVATGSQIEFIDQVKLFSYKGMVEECRQFAYDFFSILIMEGLAEKIYEYQSKKPSFGNLPATIVEMVPRIKLSENREAESYILTGKQSENKITQVEVKDGIAQILPRSSAKQSGDEWKRIVEISDLEAIAKCAGLIGMVSSEADINPKKCLIMSCVDNKIEIGFENADMEDLVATHYKLEENKFLDIKCEDGTILEVDLTFDPEEAISLDEEPLESGIKDDEVTDLKQIKKELLQYKDKEGCISLDGGSTYGTLRKINKKGPVIKIVVEFEEGKLEDANIISILNDQDFRTSAGRIVNTLPF